jgi:heme-degrading monooxygenase HmoA
MIGHMIGRLWHGWTTRANASAYEALLRSEVLPGIHRVPGYRGACLLRRDLGEEVEFVTLTLFDSMDAVRAFAGEDFEKAVVPPKARRLLARFDERSVHFDALVRPDGGPAGSR